LPSARRTNQKRTIFEHLEDPQATGTLPSLESVLTELQTLTQKSNIRLDRLTRLVQVDQGMSLRMLRMANSVYYAPTEPILDVQDAILFVGLGTFRSAVASTRCIERTCHIKQSVLNWKDFWTHAAGVGYLTSELASRLKDRELPQESFYLMGLLHDVGKVLLAHLMPDAFDEIYLAAREAKSPPAAMEMECLGVEHGHLGAWYLEKQGMPATIYEPVRFHHSGQLEGGKHVTHAAIIRLADMLALHSHMGESGNAVEVGDPFITPEWAWYVKTCEMDEAEELALRESMTDQLAGISDLVHNMIA
jgi:HD-like signal output (HDOD) protein